MSKSKSGYTILYKGFDYKGRVDEWDYEIPFETFMDAVRKYFQNQLVTIDGTDNAIWNVLMDLGDYVLDDIFDTMEDWLREKCANDAYEEYAEWVDWYYDNMGDE